MNQYNIQVMKIESPEHNAKDVTFLNLSDDTQFTGQVNFNAPLEIGMHVMKEGDVLYIEPVGYARRYEGIPFGIDTSGEGNVHGTHTFRGVKE